MIDIEKTVKKHIFINKNYENIRADRFLTKVIPNSSYGVLFKFFRQGKVKLNKRKLKFNDVLNIGDEVTCYFSIESNGNNKPVKKQPSKTLLKSHEQVIKNNILYEDENYLVLNKPANIATQGGTSIKISIDDLLRVYSKGSSYLAHRLDKKTSGVLVTAKNHKTLNHLAHCFKNSLVEKTYLALVQGKIPFNKGTIDKPLIKSNNSKRQLVVVDEQRGKQAITDFKVIASSKRGNFHLLELKPKTGRTHQIRVHLAKVLACPIVGDFKYGYEDQLSLYKTKKDVFVKDSLFLHSASIKLEHHNGDFLIFDAKLDSKWVNVLKYLEIDYA